MKSFSERDPLLFGILAIGGVVLLTLTAVNFGKLPFIGSYKEYSAYFAEAGGLRSDNPVQVSGLKVGKVSSVALDGPQVLVKFKIDKGVRLGKRTEAAIKSKSVLGIRYLDVRPRGNGQQTGPIPYDRTTSPYQLPDALGDLSTTISGLDTGQLSDSLTALTETFSDTPPALKVAVKGVARFSQTLNQRDEQLRNLLTNAKKATKVLAERSDEVVRLVGSANALLGQLETQSNALDQISHHLSAVAQQLKGFISENRETLKPALEKLDDVLTLVDNRKERVQEAIKGLNGFALPLGESLASGPFFNGYLPNLVPGQFVQPFIDAAFSDLGLDPATLSPSERVDPQTGQPGTPPLPLPYPRTGQGGEPRRTLPDAITGNPGDHLCGLPGLALPGPGCYPYREAPPAPAPGGPPPGPPAPPPGMPPAATAPRVRRSAAKAARAAAGLGGRAALRLRNVRIALAVTLVLVLIGGIVGVVRFATGVGRTNVTAYFTNSNGVYEGDDVLILGVPVGKIAKIEPLPSRVKISFWYEDRYQVPADAKAVIVSPSLVTARNIQLTPAYTGGPVMSRGAMIPQARTAVPQEYDDLRQQLDKLTEMLQPTQPGGVSTLGGFIDTAADNLRGQGTGIRDTVLELSQAASALGDHSGDLFATVKNLSILVSALRDSSGLLKQLNQKLAAVTRLVSNDPDEVGHAVRDLNSVVADVKSFVADNREALGTTSDKLASVSQAVVDSMDDVKQTLHILPNVLSNFANIYQPAEGTISIDAAFTNFSNPIQFLCSAVQAASRLGAEQSAKLCVQYLAPIIKNRQYNFPPIGANPFVGAMARPNEVTYSEDWMRPDYVAPQPPSAASSAGAAIAQPSPAETSAAAPAQPVATDPADGLRGIMVPLGGGQ